MSESSTTIIDVAKAAGVGIGTVSRVLNNSGAVKPSTAERIRRAIAQLNYQLPPPGQRRGPAVGKPRGRRGFRNILLMILGESGLQWILERAPVYASVLHGIEAAVQEHGGNLLIRQAADSQTLPAVLRQTQADAVIALGDEIAAPDSFNGQQRPAVWVMGSPQHFHGDLVQPNHMRIGVLAGDYALGQGHRHAAYLGSRLGTPGYVIEYRGTGFQWAMEHGGGHVEMLLANSLVSSDNAPNPEIVAGLIDRFAALKPRPSVLMLHSDVLAPSVYRALEQRGIQPQRDVTIITCNNEQTYLAALRPQPVIIDLQAQTIGRRAVETLIWRGANLNEPTTCVMVSPLLVEPGAKQ